MYSRIPLRGDRIQPPTLMGLELTFYLNFLKQPWSTGWIIPFCVECFWAVSVLNTGTAYFEISGVVGISPSGSIINITIGFHLEMQVDI